MSDDAKAPARRRTRAKRAPQTASDLTSLVAGKVASPRQTLPTNANILGSFPYAFLPRRQYQNVDLSSLNVSVLSPQQVIDLLSDADPDVSLAWWNFLLLTVGHWTTDARTADDKEDPKAKAALNAILAKVNAQWGGFQNVLYQFVMSILLEGACAGECILTDDLKDVRDVVSVTPWTIYFQRDSHQDLVVFQWQPMTANGLVDTGSVAPTIANVEAGSYGAAGFRPLNTTTFGYVPFMPMTDDPYGRMPFASIFQVIVFDNQLLQDLRRWAHVNAWGRLDVAVVQEMVQALMPPAVRANVNEAVQFINTYVGDVAKAIGNVGPDDAFVHLDNVQYKGVDSSGKTFAVADLIKAVERKKFRALRMLPILMGSNEGTTETHGTVQWDIMVRGLEAIQDCVATLANTLLSVGLRTLGFTSHAVVEFETVRSTDQMVEAEAEAIKISNAARKRDEGWITQDEASIEVTGSAAVADAPNPDPLVALGQPDAGSDAPVPPPASDDTTTADGPNPDDTKDAATLDSANPDGKKTPAGKATTKARAAKASDAQAFTGVMLGFFLAPKDAKKLAIPNGEPPEDLHLTLAFLGDSSNWDGDQFDLLKDKVSGFAKDASTITGKIAGIGRFTKVPEGEPTPVYASVDAPLLPGFRQDLVDAIQESYLVVDAKHGFTPHITLAYIDADAPMPMDDVPGLDLTFDTLCLAIGDDRTFYPLKDPNRSRLSPGERAALTRILADLFSEVTHANGYPDLPLPGHNGHAHGVAVAQEPATDSGRDRRRDGEADQREPSEGGIAVARGQNRSQQADHRDRRTSTKRTSITTATRNAVKAHFGAISIPREMIEQFVELAPKSRMLAPPYERAFTDGEQTTLRTAIVAALAAHTHATRAKLGETLAAYRLQSWNAAGQEALDRVNLDGTFDLTNADMLSDVSTKASTNADGITDTFLGMLAGALIVSLAGGADADQLQSDADAAIGDLSDSRSAIIANTETASAWGDASHMTWLQNGIATHSWVTNGNPDPGAGPNSETPCIDNEADGEIPIDQAFSSGDYNPPAHPSCECGEEVQGQPSDDAMDDPWTGD